MKSVTSALSTHIALDTTTLSSCIRLKRTDGKLFHFTAHDVGLYVDIGGLPGTQFYSPVDSYLPNSLTINDRLDVDEMEFTGIMSSGAVKESELRSGLFDYAEVLFFVVNWNAPIDGPLKILKGLLGGVTIRSDGVFVAEMRGLTQFLRQGIVRTYRKDCDADLGDTRCGVPIWPDTVERFTSYVKDDYVRASNALSFGLSAITTGTNLGFEDGDLTGWTTNSGTPLVQSASKGGTSPNEGTFMLTGTDGVGSWEIEQIITLSQLNSAKIDSGDYVISLSVDVGAGVTSSTHDHHTVKFEFLTAADALISTPLNISAQRMGADNDNWGMVELINELVPSTCRKVRITLGGVDVADAQMTTIFDNVVISYLDITATDFNLARATAVNPRFQIGGTGDGTFGWNEETGDWSSVIVPSPAPRLHSTFIMRAIDLLVAINTISQIYKVDGVFSTADIDAGLIKLTVDVQALGRLPIDDTYRIEIEALDGSNSLLYVIRDTGTLSISVADVWNDHTVSVTLESGVRNIRLSITTERIGVSSKIHFDMTYMVLEHLERNSISEDFDDRIYRCTTGGTTAEIQPTYDTVVGNSTTDGTAVFITEEAWSRSVEVIAVDGTEPRRIFTVTELTPNTGGVHGGFADDFMNDGGMTWDTGSNAGRTMEIKDFTADDGMTIEQIIELQLEMPFDVTVGDKGRCYPGCDKRRQTCRDRFANFVIRGEANSGLRLRGFPDLPGQGFLNRTPDFKASTSEVS